MMNDYSIQSSNIECNKYINNQKIVEKPWGREIWLELNEKYCYKRIEIKAGFKTSYQFHNFKLETNYIIKGNAEVWLENDDNIVQKFNMSEGDFFTVIPTKKHRVIAITDVILQEVSTPEVDDVIRINDEFNRSDGKIEEEHHTPIVCILAAGIGSRLGELSKSCHKTLIPYKHKAILTHIIEQFNPNVEIVIAVGYFKEQIIEYINFVHSDRNIKFIDVDPYIGKGSGPAHSIDCCRNYLQKPFYFCVSDFYSDTVIQNDILSTDNWIGLCNTTTPEIYSTVEIKDGKILKLINKSPDGFSNAFTGLFYMYDYKHFWNSFDTFVDEKKEIVDVFKDIQTFNFKIKNIDWCDVGTLDLYNNFINVNEENNLYLHNTKHEFKYNKNNIFIKKIESTKKIQNLIKRSEYLKEFIPHILKYGNYFLSYEYVKGNTLYFSNSKDKYIDFLKWFETFFCKTNEKIVSSNAYDFYKLKTEKRFILFKELNSHKFCQLDNITVINGKTILPMEQYLNMIDWNELATIVPTTLFHGDLQFDNIIITPKGDFKLIDWREDFGGDTVVGDLYYDLAKLYGGMELNYLEMKKSDNYNCVYDDNSCIIIQYVDPILKSIQENEFKHFLTANNFNEYRVKLLTSIIYLNMAPLHINNFDVFLFFKAKQLFSEIFTP